MSHKVNPISYRLIYNKNWSSKWFSKHHYADILLEDILLRQTIEKKLDANFGIESIGINRSTQEINIIINTAKPGMIIGRAGEGIENLKKYLEKKLIKIRARRNEFIKPFPKKTAKEKLKITIQEIHNPEIQAMLVAKNIAYQLEKRVAYRRAVNQALEKTVSHKEVKGIKVRISGRLGGVDIARKEKFIKGSIPLQSIKIPVDYAQVDTRTTYGIIGIKVWIYKEEENKK